jgi:hypothetical protein
MKFPMHGIRNHIPKGILGLNCKSPIQHYLLACLLGLLPSVVVRVVEMKPKHELTEGKKPFNDQGRPSVGMMLDEV